MISPRALLFDMGEQSTVRSVLQTILDSDFQIEILGGFGGREASDLIASGDIQELLTRFDPLVIFLILTNELSGDEEIVASVKKKTGAVPLIAVVDVCEPQRVLALLRCGVADFVTTPLKTADVLARTWKLVLPPANNTEPLKLLNCGPDLAPLVGESPGFLAQVRNIPLIAKYDANVLIEGETGTGKEVHARAIHYCSPRAGKPFVPVNCGAIPPELLENELFGHERGAFTSAVTLQTGLIEEANGGTLFLDEIDCLPPLAQVKLLRFLQEKEYRPLGSSRIRQADVRIIAASNLPLEQAVEVGKVRPDLFYRLKIISLSLAPLRERREDIPTLARHFVAKYTAAFGKEITGLSRGAMHSLMVHSWPGNVRELEHVIERAIVMAEGLLLQPTDLVFPTSQITGRCESLQQAKAKEIARFEKNYIKGLLSACEGNITRAAQVAQKNRRAFWQLIQKHQIDVTSFKSKVS
jgi:two-component system, NtrC family, response regulator GlrR